MAFGRHPFGIKLTLHRLAVSWSVAERRCVALGSGLLTTLSPDLACSGAEQRRGVFARGSGFHGLNSAASRSSVKSPHAEAWGCSEPRGDASGSLVRTWRQLSAYGPHKSVLRWRARAPEKVRPSGVLERPHRSADSRNILFVVTRVWYSGTLAQHPQKTGAHLGWLRDVDCKWPLLARGVRCVQLAS